MPDRRYKCRTECVLDHRRGDKGCYSDQPGLLDAEFHAKREPCKSGRENHDVPKSHRHKKPRYRAVPASLAQPSRDEGRGHETGKIAGGRTQERRKTAHGTREHRQSNGPFREIGNDRCAAEAPAAWLQKIQVFAYLSEPPRDTRNGLAHLVSRTGVGK